MRNRYLSDERALIRAGDAQCAMRRLAKLSSVGLLGLIAIGSAHADTTSTWTAASDYDFRGNSQTATDPAVQATFDYTSNGFSAGIFGSNVDFGPALGANYEIDVYAGFTGTLNETVGWESGIIYYVYPQESDINYVEIYGGLSYQWVKAKLWYSNQFNGDFGKDLARSTSAEDDVAAFYLEGNAAIPLPRNFSLLLHAGVSTGGYWDNAIGDDVIDYSIGAGYSTGRFNVALEYVDTDTGDVSTVTDDVFNQEGRVLLTVATTFPWKK